MSTAGGTMTWNKGNMVLAGHVLEGGVMNISRSQPTITSDSSDFDLLNEGTIVTAPSAYTARVRTWPLSHRPSTYANPAP
jgi:hypothetical protein